MTRIRISIGLSELSLSGIDALGIRNAIEEQIEANGQGRVVAGECAIDGSEIELTVQTDDYSASEDFISELLLHADLKDRLELPAGIPSHDTIGRVL